ncbi:MAG: hypothetical protein KJI71_05385 [Patescibacteria group bacterium]|nr:hypothetical protein [Patescibacteria group bacterium]
MRQRKPNGYWESEANVIEEAERVMKENGFDALPGMKILNELGESALGSGIYSYHGGMRKFRERLGQEQREKSKGYWQDPCNVVLEAEFIKGEHGFDMLLGSQILRKLGYSNFVAAINNYHGGMRNFREITGEDQVIREKRVWKNLEFALEQARELKKKHNLDMLPSGRTLTSMGYSGLINAIGSYYGGMTKFRQLLGEEVRRVRSEDLRNPKYVLKEAERVKEEHGFDYLPGVETLNRIGYFSLTNAINRHHGGIVKFRKLLGETLQRKPNGYWNKWGNARRELSRVMEEIRHFPNQKELQSRGLSSLAVAITRTYGGMNAVRKKLGESVTKRDNEHYRDWVVVEHKVELVLQDHPELDGKIPSAYWLQRNGYFGLVNGIKKHHGGFGRFRELMGMNPGQVERGRWRGLEYTIIQAENFMQEHGFESLPGGGILNRLGYSSLGAAITKYHKGLPFFRELLRQRQGLPSERQQLEGMLETYVEDVA